jgi:hypothetical protein
VAHHAGEKSPFHSEPLNERSRLITTVISKTFFHCVSLAYNLSQDEASALVVLVVLRDRDRTAH